MTAIGRVLMILLGLFVATLAASAVMVAAVLFPDVSNLQLGPIDEGGLAIIVGVGFIFVSGFALLPALIVVLITEAFSIRSVLAYAVGGAAVGAACYLSLVPFDPAAMQFDGIIRRHLEVMTGAGIVGGLAYWLTAGRNAGLWRRAASR